MLNKMGSYNQVRMVFENLIEEENKYKKLYNYLKSTCKPYDKEIFDKIHTKKIKHCRLLEEVFMNLYGYRYAFSIDKYLPESEKYDIETYIINRYDILDDYSRIYCNLDNDENKNIIFEIMNDIQRNMTLLNVVYLGED